jgi:hypothetical protein
MPSGSYCLVKAYRILGLDMRICWGFLGCLILIYLCRSGIVVPTWQVQVEDLFRAEDSALAGMAFAAAVAAAATSRVAAEALAAAAETLRCVSAAAKQVEAA